MNLNFIKYFLLILLSTLLIYCSHDEFNQSTITLVDFSEAESYDSFLFVESKIDTLTVSLNLEFNDWSKEKDAFAEILITDLDKQALDEKTSILLNGKLQADQIFRVNANQDNLNDTKISIVFNELEDFDLRGYVMIKDTNLDRINEIEFNGDRVEFLKWKAKNTVVLNPLKKGLIIFFIVIVLGLLIWLLFLKRIVFKPMPKGQIVIKYPQYLSMKTKNTREIRLGGERFKQGLVGQLFKGKKSFYNYIAFSQSIDFKPGINNTIRVKLPSGYTIKPATTYIKKGVSYEIKNTENRITLTFI